MGKPRCVAAQLLSFILSIWMLATFPAEQPPGGGYQNGLPDRRCLQPASLEKAALVLDEYESKMTQLGAAADESAVRTDQDLHDVGDKSREEETVSTSGGASSSCGEGGRLSSNGIQGAFYNASEATGIPDFGDVLSNLDMVLGYPIHHSEVEHPRAGAGRKRLPRWQGDAQRSTDPKGEERRAKRAQYREEGRAQFSEFAQSQMRKMGYISGQVGCPYFLARNAGRKQGRAVTVRNCKTRPGMLLRSHCNSLSGLKLWRFGLLFEFAHVHKA